MKRSLDFCHLTNAVRSPFRVKTGLTRPKRYFRSAPTNGYCRPSRPFRFRINRSHYQCTLRLSFFAPDDAIVGHHS